MATTNPLSLVLLAEQFAKLPGIGMKTAQKLAYHVITSPFDEAKKFSDAILNAHTSVKYCKLCQNFSDNDVCDLCNNAKRDQTIICVVEGPKDVDAIERTNEYKGLYHVLHGLISPIDGVSPNDLKIKELLARVTDATVKEVIMATNPTVEGEATAIYLSKLLKPLGVVVSRLAFGLPVGGILEYADEVTLFRAIENRNEM